MKKAIKITIIVVISLLAITCIEALFSCYTFDRSQLDILGMIGMGILCIGGAAALIFIWSSWSELQEYRKKEKDYYVYAFKKQSTNVSDNRFVRGENISSFMNKYKIDYYFFYDLIIGLGLKNQMEWYEIKQRYKEAKKRIKYCKFGTDEWNEAQQMLEVINKDAQFFVRSNYDLNDQLYIWEKEHTDIF